MPNLFAFALAAIAYLVPDAEPHTELASAIAAASEESPIFAGDDGRRTASLMVAVAFLETGKTFDCSLVGDNGRSVSCFQIWRDDSSERARIRANGLTAARVARDMLAASMHTCRRLPTPEILSQYTSGKCQRNPESRARWALGQRLFRIIEVE